MRKNRAFTIIEVMIVVMVIGILMAIAVPNWIRARERSRTESCYANMREIEHAKQRFAIENKLSGTAPVSAAEIAPEFLKNAMPLCPSAGTYTIGTVDATPSCSIHGVLPY